MILAEITVFASPDLGFVVAGYVVIIGGLTAYAVRLWRRARSR